MQENISDNMVFYNRMASFNNREYNTIRGSIVMSPHNSRRSEYIISKLETIPEAFLQPSEQQLQLLCQMLPL